MRPDVVVDRIVGKGQSHRRAGHADTQGARARRQRLSWEHRSRTGQLSPSPTRCCCCPHRRESDWPCCSSSRPRCREAQTHQRPGDRNGRGYGKSGDGGRGLSPQRDIPGGGTRCVLTRRDHGVIKACLDHVLDDIVRDGGADGDRRRPGTAKGNGHAATDRLRRDRRGVRGRQSRASGLSPYHTCVQDGSSDRVVDPVAGLGAGSRSTESSATASGHRYRSTPGQRVDRAGRGGAELNIRRRSDGRAVDDGLHHIGQCVFGDRNAGGDRRAAALTTRTSESHTARVRDNRRGVGRGQSHRARARGGDGAVLKDLRLEGVLDRIA